MGGVVEAVTGGIGDVVEGVGDAVGGLVQGVGDAVSGIVNSVGEFVSNLAKDPLSAIATVLSVVFPPFAPLIMGANAALHGGDLGDIALAAVGSWAGAQAGAFVGDQVGTSMQFGTELGSQQTAMLAAQNAGMGAVTGLPALAAAVSGAGTAAVTSSLISTGQINFDAVGTAMLAGGVGVGVKALASEIPGFDELPKSAQNAAKAAMTAALSGGDASAAALKSALGDGFDAIKNNSTVKELVNRFSGATKAAEAYDPAAQAYNEQVASYNAYQKEAQANYDQLQSIATEYQALADKFNAETDTAIKESYGPQLDALAKQYTDLKTTYEGQLTDLTKQQDTLTATSDKLNVLRSDYIAQTIKAVAPDFNAGEYLRRNPGLADELAKSGMTPAEHFLSTGAGQGLTYRDPVQNSEEWLAKRNESLDAMDQAALDAEYRKLMGQYSTLKPEDNLSTEDLRTRIDALDNFVDRNWQVTEDGLTINRQTQIAYDQNQNPIGWYDDAGDYHGYTEAAIKNGYAYNPNGVSELLPGQNSAANLDALKKAAQLFTTGAQQKLQQGLQKTGIAQKQAQQQATAAAQQAGAPTAMESIKPAEIQVNGATPYSDSAAAATGQVGIGTLLKEGEIPQAQTPPQPGEAPRAETPYEDNNVDNNDSSYWRAGGVIPNSNFGYMDQVEAMASGGIATLAHGGSTGSNLGSYSDGGQLLKGPGTGLSDNIPATINRTQPARLADGEFVVPADVVSALGGGSTEAGANILYEMLDRIRHAAHGKTQQIKKVDPSKVLPK